VVEGWRLADAVTGRWEYGPVTLSTSASSWELERRLYPRLALTSVLDMIGAELGAWDLDNIAGMAGLGTWETAVFCADLAATRHEPEDLHRRLGAAFSRYLQHDREAALKMWDQATWPA
jgi:hypothetical protein